MRFYKPMLVLVLATACLACTDNSKPAASNHYQVKALPLHKSLHFTGTVQPLEENTLTTPLEAVVEKMHFHYGQQVKAGDTVFTLHSTQMQKQYNDLVTDYLKAKDNYVVAKAKFVGTQSLWNAGLIAKNNYLSEKSSVNTSRVTLMQSTGKLNELMQKMGTGSSQDLANVSLSDFDKVSHLLTSEHNRLHIKAAQDGVLLYPPQTQDSSTAIKVGTAIKAGQVLALIGNLNGISVEIDVPEIDIDKIHAGMHALVTGVAFGKHQLHGNLVAVNAQASSTSKGSLPSFTAIVTVQGLQPSDAAWIKVGMSAAIELQVDTLNQLLVPITAVKRGKDNNFVLLQLAQGKVEKRPIVTGSAQSDSVVIESGLKAGDVVIYE